MIRRSTKIFLEFIIGLLAGLALLAGMAVWRLASGPVPLDFLTPYLEEVFAETRSGMTVEVGETLLSWAGWSRTLDLRARDVTIRNAEGGTVVVLPDASVTLSLRALLRGTVAPTLIEVIGARVTLERGLDGRFRLTSGPPSQTPETAPGEPEFSGVVPALVDLFLRAPDPSNPLGYLTEVRLLEGRLVIDDRRLNTLWIAPTATMELRRHDTGIAAFMGFELALGEGLADADLALFYDDARGRIDVTARVLGMRTGVLASLVPGMESLTGVRLPIDASASAVLDVEGRLRSLNFGVTGGAGEIALPGLLPETLSVAGFDLRGDFDGETGRLEVPSLELRLGTAEVAGPKLTATAAITGLGGDPGGDWEIAAEARVDKLPTDELKHYWPEGASRGGRKWTLGHMEHGAASNAGIRISALVPGGDFKAARVTGLEGGFDYSGLTVHYLRGMPPIAEGRGQATFDRTGLRFQVAGGQVGDLRLSGAQVDILGLEGKENRRIVIDGNVTGPLPQAFEILDHERLNLLHRIGIRPEEASGLAEARLVFRIPLIKGLKFKHVDFSAEARIRQGRVADFLLGRDGAEMALDLDIDRTGMTVTGPLELGGVPAALDWREDFTREADQRTLLKLEFPTVDTAGRRALGFDWAPYLEGPASASIVARVRHDRSGEVEVTADLERSRLAFPFLFWEKPAGVEARARVDLSLVDGKVAAIERFDVEGGGLLARGRGAMTPDGRNFQTLDFEHLSYHGTAVYGASLARDGAGYAVALGGGVVDVAAFLETSPREANGATGGSGEEPRRKTPLRISGRRMESLYFAEGRNLRGVDLEMERSVEGWERVSIRGEVPRHLWVRKRKGAAAGGEVADDGGRTFDLQFGPSGMGDYRLAVTMNDMGAVLRALDAIDTVTGGELVISGLSPGPALDHPIEGRIEAQDYTLVEAPVMAKLLSLASLSGIGDVLSGDGIQFKRLVGDFTLEDGVATTDLVRAYGRALGLTAKGSIDFRAKRFDLRGTVVPAYTVNRLLGKIPILGPLLVGGEGEGVVAFIYEMKGPFGEPEISVNPLSALTPGFLRGLFGLGSGGEGETGDGDETERPEAFPRAADR